jgi:hypothetical protein
MSNNQPKHTMRELESRTAYARPEMWAPPEILPTPDPIEGYSLRYVRTAIHGQDDAPSYGRAVREGYEPVTIEEQPRLAALCDPTSRHKGCIEIGGLLLMKTPIEFVRQREAHYAKITRQAQQAVDNSLMKENDPRMPLFNERKTKVTFGSGGA